MAVLKRPEERYTTIRYERLIDKHQKDINELKRKQNRFKDNKERCQKYEEKILYAMQKQEYYYWKTQDPIAICEDFEISPTVNMDMVEFHLKHLFPQGNPYVSIMVKEENIRRKMLHLDMVRSKIPHILSLDMNTYISPAIYAHQRKKRDCDGEELIIKGAYKELVLETHAIIIDLDYRNTDYGGLLAEDFYEQMKDEGAFNIIPEPSYSVVSSEGRGMQMVYLLDESYKTFLQSKEVVRYEDTVSRMIEHFLPYGSDPACCDIGHLYRCPCSFNTKAHSYAYILDWKNLRDDEYEVIQYSFKDLEKYSAEALGTRSEPINTEPIPVTTPIESKPVKAAKRPRKKAVKEAKTTTDSPSLSAQLLGRLSNNRCNDLRSLIYIRKRDLIGFRHILLTVYASQYANLCKYREDNYNILLKELLDVNKLFHSPLRENEIITIAESSLRKRYLYKDEKICELLNITETELQQLKYICHPVQPTEQQIAERKARQKANSIARRAKLLRTQDGELKSVVKRRERNLEIIKLRQQGVSLERIAEMFDLTTRAIRYILKNGV